MQPCFRDPGGATFGLHNVLYRLGDTFLEVVSPTEEGTTAGRLLDKRNGDGGYMVIVETDDLDAVRSRLDEHEVRIVFEATEDGISGLHLHSRDVGGAIVSIDATDTWGQWPWAGPDWESAAPASHAGAIVGATIHADDPQAMASRWADVLGLGAPVMSERGTVATLTMPGGPGDGDGGVFTFIPVPDDRGEGLGGITCVAAGDSDGETHLDLRGVSVDFVPD